MELGRTSRSVLMLSGVVKDHDDSEHVVSFSSGEQNDQFVAVVTAGLLGVAPERGSIVAAPGTTTELRVRVSRAQAIAERAVEVRLLVPAHVQGVAADPVTVAPGQDEAVLRIRWGANAGPFNMSAAVRATTLGEGDAHVAEGPIEFVGAAAAATAIST